VTAPAVEQLAAKGATQVVRRTFYRGQQLYNFIEARFDSARDVGLVCKVQTQFGEPGLFRLLQAGINPDAYRNARAFIDIPAMYTRPDRMRGEVARESGGYRVNWRPGYRPYNRAEPYVRRNRGGFRVHSSRPYHPRFNRRARFLLAEQVVQFVATGGAVGRDPFAGIQPFETGRFGEALSDIVRSRFETRLAGVRVRGGRGG
jgi:hypothetical protein